MSCLAPEHKIWEIFHGYNPDTQLRCSTHECLERSEKVEKHYLPFRYKIYCHCYNKEINDQKQMSYFL